MHVQPGDIEYAVVGPRRVTNRDIADGKAKRGQRVILDTLTSGHESRSAAEQAAYDKDKGDPRNEVIGYVAKRRKGAESRQWRVGAAA